MLRTRMFSLSFFTPGTSPQMPRTTRSIFTPAAEAAYKASITGLSMRLLI